MAEFEANPAFDLSVPPLAELHQRRSQKWVLHAPDVLSATIAEMDFPLAPPVADALRSAIARHDLGYATPAPRSLRRAFAGFAARRFDWPVDEEQVWLVPDVMYGLIELCRAVSAPGDSVAFATPAYPPFLEELPGGGVTLTELALLDDGSLDLASLDAALAAGIRALILVNPHNPTGRVLPKGELSAIAERCAEHEVWVFANEIHAPLTLAGAAHTPWLEVSDAARHGGVALTSASKAFNVAGLKAALLVTAGGRSRELVARIPPMWERAGLLGVVAAEAAFSHADAWLDALLDLLGQNRAQLAAELASELPEIDWTPPQGTYLAWLDCTALGLGEDPAAVFLERGRLALSPGPHYGRPGAGHARLNFGTSPELVSEMVRRMRHAVER